MVFCIFYIPYLFPRPVSKIEILPTKMQTDITQNLSQTCNLKYLIHYSCAVTKAQVLKKTFKSIFNRTWFLANT